MTSTPRADDSVRYSTFLLGKVDKPADGVEDYCEYLGRALAHRGIIGKISHVTWAEHGWMRGLHRLWEQSKEWGGQWVILQYTSLGWSSRGFPLGALATFAILRYRGASIAIMFHEPFGLGGQRRIDRIRGSFQNWVIRQLYWAAEKSIFPVPLATLRWLPGNDKKAVFIPIGANIPDGAGGQVPHIERNELARTIAVYCLSEPPHMHRELRDISHAVRASAKNGTRLRVVFFGRGTAQAKNEIRSAFEGIPAEVVNHGLQAPEEVRRILDHADVMLCVRGPLYPRRGSALAGIACGLPIVGYAGEANGTPIAEAGVELVPYGDEEALAEALERVLVDQALWQQLHDKSLEAQKRYFSWELIAEKFDQALCGSRAGE